MSSPASKTPEAQRTQTRAALAWLDSLQGQGIRPGLGRIRALLRRLGHPERAFRSILVAGTNGKGSTSATLESILRASGHRTGLYTSPHLVDIRERWVISGQPIDHDLFLHCVAELHEAAERTAILPTYFEALTIIAFIAFRAAGCDIVVLEVGMGGRLDATNVARPIAAVITPIGFDHMEYLGNTIRKIASEKAGVIHRGAVVLTSNRDEVVLSVLRRRAEKFGNRFVVVEPGPIAPVLRGDFQKDNVSLAIRTAEELAPIVEGITAASIREGVARTKWRGRLEQMLVGGKEVWIDGCHNGHAAAAVAPFIETLPRPRVLLFGIMGDKDVTDVENILFPLFNRIITTEPYPPRSVTAGVLAETAQSFGIAAIAEPDPAAALERALAAPEPLLFVAGSLYLAGTAIELLDAKRESGGNEQE